MRQDRKSENRKDVDVEQEIEEATQEKAELVGLDVVLDALSGEDFPMDRETLYYSVGDIEVPGLDGKLVPMRIVLDRISETRFETLGQAVTAIKHALHPAQRPQSSRKRPEI